MAVRAQDFQIPKITHEEVNENRGVFVIEPLDRGFGYTFGNSLRRVLLSSLEGAAVTSVKLEGVAHEFTTLPGVREDVTDIILNLKQLVCILHGESPEVEVRLTKRGEGIVTAADIEAPADLEILNPELEIANLSSKGRLEITLTIGRGRGYVPAEGNRGQAHTIGVIPVDSMFSPIRRVAYDVEAARVGQRTDYDKLILDVTTNGSIDPKDAIAQAAEILIRQLAIFTDLEKMEGFGEARRPRPSGADSVGVSLARGMENFPIEELELGVRSYNCLKRVGIETIGDLVTKTENELAAIPNFGKKSIEEVKETLAAARPAPPRRRGRQRRGGVEADVRHERSGKKLGRDSAHRKALYANLAGALIEHGRIKTTVTKAKAVKPIAEQMITLGRRGDLHARRQAIAFLRSRDVVHKLFAEVAPRFEDRPGGYSRIIRIGPRPGDAAEMAYLELVDEEYVAKEREERDAASPSAAVPRRGGRGGARGARPRRSRSRRRAEAEASRARAEAEADEPAPRATSPRPTTRGLDADADEGADDRRSRAPPTLRSAERLREARAEEPPADHGERDQLEARRRSPR